MFGCKLVNVPLIVNGKLMKDDKRKKGGCHFFSYKILIENLLYLITTRLDVIFAASFFFFYVHEFSKSLLYWSC